MALCRDSLASEADSSTETPARALVMFEDRSDVTILRLLRTGFRHCFCVVGTDWSWTLCDPLKTRIELTQLNGFGERELADHFRQSGRSVLVGSVEPARKNGRIRVRAVSCVEIVKRIINLDVIRAFTPYQLRSALLQQGFVDHGTIDIATK